MAMLTTSETAALLRVSDDTVRRMLRSGELSGVRVGRLWRVRSQCLRAYL